MQNSGRQGVYPKEITQQNIDEMACIIIQDILKKTGDNKAEAARHLATDH